ncbi:Fungal-trans domain-containing protein [Fusarium keratoplasticum]|uniref:Fungal-trans domain-containing protein n=1 Tax=Fusarium keratoplasticum TaxID=1328300 RepID=A0ACC0R1Z2_9HYPO|nr:Fungal-trans domain-containing protein [Fusarium keratoplasticum]KAI8671891.1 Fungal-trans domain-containing protein [Fusarium keratoplasticum]
MTMETLLRLDTSSMGSKSDGEPRSHSELPPQPPQATPAANGTLKDSVFQTDSYNILAQSSNELLLDAAGYSRRLSLALAAHIEVFLKHLFPIMPVVNGEEILSDAIWLEELPLP